VVGYLASTGTAEAHDPAAPSRGRVAKAPSAALVRLAALDQARPSQSPAPSPARTLVAALPTLSETALLRPMVEQSVEQNDPSASVEGNAERAPSGPGAGASTASGGTSAEPVSCAPSCPPKRKSVISRLPQIILHNLDHVPVLAAVIVPMTEGVTITPAEGLPAVTFALKPTKITRGSGLVAVGQF
jgi:hypothetical protein